MARLIGFIANRPDLGPRAIALEPVSFAVRRADEASGALGWGLGFHQGGEVLLRRRPVDERRVVELVELVRDVRAEVLVGSVRPGAIGELGSENTCPFRYRQWLYAQSGAIADFEPLRQRFLESLPQFLARDVRGDTDAELVFYLFLSFLHDAGQLDRAEVPLTVAKDAVRGTLALVDRLVAEEGGAPPELNMVIACGGYVLAARRSRRRMGCLTIEGRAALERLYADEDFSRTRVPHLAQARLRLVASDFDGDVLPSGYVEVPERSLVALTFADGPVIDPIG
jgi:predicted glutamine amidotransferase